MDRSLSSTIGGLFSCIAMCSCATVGERDEIPDFIVQHTLNSLTSEESFAWVDPAGRALNIRPLGTFKSGDYYCRDYQVTPDQIGGVPMKRSACHFEGRWTDVNPANLDFL